MKWDVSKPDISVLYKGTRHTKQVQYLDKAVVCTSVKLLNMEFEVRFTSTENTLFNSLFSV